MKFININIFAAIIILCLSSFVAAYSGDVHERINEEAILQSSMRELLINNVGVKPDPNKPDILDKLIVNKTIKQWIAYGGEAEYTCSKSGKDRGLPLTCDRISACIL